jgi:hypothetical protein
MHHHKLLTEISPIKRREMEKKSVFTTFSGPLTKKVGKCLFGNQKALNAESVS